MSIDFCDNIIDKNKCMACEIVSGIYSPPGGIIYENNEFVIHQDPLVAIPGFLIISPKHHIFSIDALTPVEKQNLGYIIAFAEEATKAITHVNYLSIIQEDCIKDGHMHIWIFPWHDFITREYKISLNNIRKILNRYHSDKRYAKETLQTISKIKDFIKYARNTNAILNFQGQDLTGQDFSERNLNHANFCGAILKRCNFSNCNLSFASFDNADLYRADFSGATLYSTTFRGADLTRANFQKSVLYGAKIFGADLSHAIFDKTITEELNKEYSKAEDVYNTIKRAYSENGNKEESAKYYYKQCVAKRKQKKGLRRFFDWLIADLLIGYGERLGRCLIISFIVIIGFACAYFFMANKNDIFGAIITSISIFFGFDPIGIFLNFDKMNLFFAFEKLSGLFLFSLALIGVARKIVRD